MTQVAALLAGLAVAVTLTRPAPGTWRLARAVVPAGSRSMSGPFACAVGGLALVVVGGWPMGVLLGAALALLGPAALVRLEPAAVRKERDQLVADVPLVLDLLAACLTGGSSLAAAADVVARAVPGPCGRRLDAVRNALLVGTPPGEAWLALGAGQDDPLTPTARLLARAAESGTPPAAAVSRSAVDARARARARSAQAARRVGVLVVAPLGLAFLPAFVLLGIVPVVIGLAAPLFATF